MNDISLFLNAMCLSSVGRELNSGWLWANSWEKILLFGSVSFGFMRTKPILWSVAKTLLTYLGSFLIFRKAFAFWICSLLIRASWWSEAKLGSFLVEAVACVETSKKSSVLLTAESNLHFYCSLACLPFEFWEMKIPNTYHCILWHVHTC